MRWPSGAGLAGTCRRRRRRGRRRRAAAQRGVAGWSVAPRLTLCTPAALGEVCAGGATLAQLRDRGGRRGARCAAARACGRPGASSGSSRLDDHVQVALAALQRAVAEQRAARCARAAGAARRSSGNRIRLTSPCSSSSSRKTTPLALAGRWRAIARPGSATRVPLGSVARSALDDDVRRGRGAAWAIGCSRTREAGVRVVGHQQVPLARLGQRGGGAEARGRARAGGRRRGPTAGGRRGRAPSSSRRRGPSASQAPDATSRSSASAVQLEAPARGRAPTAKWAVLRRARRRPPRRASSPSPFT